MVSKAVISLSVLSFIFSVITGLMTLFLVVVDGPYNIIDNVVTGMRIGGAAVAAQALFITLFNTRFGHGSSLTIIDKEKTRSWTWSILKSGITLLLASFVFHAVAVCFGAPFIECSDLTYNFAMLMAIVVFLPCCLTVGPDVEKWFQMLTLNSDLYQETIVSFTSICSLLGAWLGAVPIPLDWDRPWQEWPRSCAIGALAGYSVGLFGASVYLPRKYGASMKAKFT